MLSYKRMPSVRSRSLSTAKKKSSLRRRSSVAVLPVVHPRGHAHCRAHHYWMVATLVAFPIGLAFATMVGLGPVLSFLMGAVGSLVVLLLNILLEHEFWMFDSHWRLRFEDPDFSHRLLVVSGALLLVIQTSFFIFLLIDQPFAVKLVQRFVTAQL